MNMWITYFVDIIFCKLLSFPMESLVKRFSFMPITIIGKFLRYKHLLSKFEILALKFSIITYSVFLLCVAIEIRLSALFSVQFCRESAWQRKKYCLKYAHTGFLLASDLF